MLFDLRSRRRRHTVRVVYLFLALIMLGGLLLVGVGTGNNNGGLLNAFTNNGSGGGQSQAFTQATKAALRLTKKHPNSAAAWAKLLTARWSAASSGSDYNTTTDKFTKDGKVQLAGAATAWGKYLALTSDKPSEENANLAAQVYQGLGKWGDASTAWQYVINTEPAGSEAELQGYICTALSAYAAKLTGEGELAASTALKRSPKADKLEMKTTFSSAKSSAATAASDAASEC